MQPPAIVLFPWVTAILLELWLITVLFRRGLNRSFPTFTSMIVIYAVVDLVVFAAALARFHTYEFYAFRQVCSSVVRSWMLIELCRQLLMGHRRTRVAMVAAIGISAAVLLVGGFSIFHQDLVSHVNGSFREIGVWFRTAYFTQVGVIAALFLMTFRNVESSKSRYLGIGIGLATTSGAELVSLTLRGRPDVLSPYAYISLNYIASITALSIWLMFMTASFGSREGEAEMPEARIFQTVK